MTEQNYSAFEGLDLSNARNENETREEYKSRQKLNKQILKIYNTAGREKFQQMFPKGVHEALGMLKEVKKINAEKLGKAK